MGGKGTAFREEGTTFLTLEVLFTCMKSRVYLQHVLVAETAPTNCACVRLLTCDQNVRKIIYHVKKSAG
jgi:hypothetical protein